MAHFSPCLFVLDVFANFVKDSLVRFCLERADLLAFLLACVILAAILDVCVTFLFGVFGRMWNSIV